MKEDHDRSLHRRKKKKIYERKAFWITLVAVIIIIIILPVILIGSFVFTIIYINIDWGPDVHIYNYSNRTHIINLSIHKDFNIIYEREIELVSGEYKKYKDIIKEQGVMTVYCVVGNQTRSLKVSIDNTWESIVKIYLLNNSIEMFEVTMI